MTPSINNSMGFLEWSLLIVLSILWGGSFFFVGVAVTEIPPLTIVLLRVGIAAITLWSIALYLGIQLPKGVKAWKTLLEMGVLNNVIPFTLIVWGQTHIESGLASILNASTPIFAVIVAGIFLSDERLTTWKLLGVITGLAGVAVMIGLPAIGGYGSVLAQVAIIGAALSYAFAGVYGRRFKAMGLNPLITAAGQVTTSTIVLIPLALLVEGPIDITNIKPQIWISIVGLAIFSTALAYVLYFKILELAGATNVLLVTLLVPISAILLGWFFLHESLAPVHFFGMGLVAIGLLAIDGRLLKQLSHGEGLNANGVNK